MTDFKGPDGFTVIRHEGICTIRMESSDGNRLPLAKVKTLTYEVEALAAGPSPMPLIITGNDHFFSVGADLNEISQLNGAQAYDFAPRRSTSHERH